MAIDIASLLRRAVSTLDEKTESIQATVTHWPFLSVTESGGGVEYGAPVQRKAIVSMKQKNLYREDGTAITVLATISFLDAIETEFGPLRTGPIDNRDKFVLPNGFSGPVVAVLDGVIDPDTGQGFTKTVMLGVS